MASVKMGEDRQRKRVDGAGDQRCVLAKAKVPRDCGGGHPCEDEAREQEQVVGGDKANRRLHQQGNRGGNQRERVQGEIRTDWIEQICALEWRLPEFDHRVPEPPEIPKIDRGLEMDDPALPQVAARRLARDVTGQGPRGGDDQARKERRFCQCVV